MTIGRRTFGMKRPASKYRHTLDSKEIGSESGLKHSGQTFTATTQGYFHVPDDMVKREMETIVKRNNQAFKKIEE